MMVQLTMIKDNLEDDKARMPFEWMGVSTELHTFLDKEIGNGISAQLIHINDMLAEMYQMNPTGVRTFDPLNVEPDKIPDASKRPRNHHPEPRRLGLQMRPPRLPKVQAWTRRGCSHWAWQLATNRRQPSNRATAGGGGTSSTVANSTTSSSQHQGADKPAITHRDDRTSTQSLEVEGGKPFGQKRNSCFRKGASQLNYMDIRKIMDRWMVQQKKGLLTDAEIQKLVSERQDKRCEADLNQATINREEVKTMEEKLQK